MHSLRSSFFTPILDALLALHGLPLASSEHQSSGTIIDPPPVDESALIGRLVPMAQPSRGERAIIVIDPRY